jgi:hypothetical protein
LLDQVDVKYKEAIASPWWNNKPTWKLI